MNPQTEEDSSNALSFDANQTRFLANMRAGAHNLKQLAEGTTLGELGAMILREIFLRNAEIPLSEPWAIAHADLLERLEGHLTDMPHPCEPGVMIAFPSNLKKPAL